MNWKQQLFEKLTSGRWLLTVICGGVFAYMSCTGLIEPKDALMVIGIVITFYFTRSREVPTTSEVTTTTTTVPPITP
jgi:hypothetical protein